MCTTRKQSDFLPEKHAFIHSFISRRPSHARIMHATEKRFLHPQALRCDQSSAAEPPTTDVETEDYKIQILAQLAVSLGETNNEIRSSCLIVIRTCKRTCLNVRLPVQAQKPLFVCKVWSSAKKPTVYTQGRTTTHAGQHYTKKDKRKQTSKQNRITAFLENNYEGDPKFPEVRLSETIHFRSLCCCMKVTPIRTDQNLALCPCLGCAGVLCVCDFCPLFLQDNDNNLFLMVSILYIQTQKQIHNFGVNI